MCCVRGLGVNSACGKLCFGHKQGLGIFWFCFSLFFSLLVTSIDIPLKSHVACIFEAYQKTWYN